MLCLVRGDKLGKRSCRLIALKLPNPSAYVRWQDGPPRPRIVQGLPSMTLGDEASDVHARLWPGFFAGVQL
jgi:hypothetical protein